MRICRIAIGLVALLTCSRGAAQAEAKALCAAEVVQTPPDSNYPLGEPQSVEMLAGIGLVGDWRLADPMRVAGVLNFEVIPLLDVPRRLRVGFAATVLYGSAGSPRDDAELNVGVGATLRWGPPVLMNDFFDMFGLAQLGVAIAPEHAFWSFRPRIGLGARLLRVAALEVAYAPWLAIDDRYADRKRAHHGLTIDLVVDLCVEVDCSVPKPPPTKQVNLDCQLYAQAHAICEDTPDRTRLCEEVARALDAYQHPGDARYDGVEGMLSSLAASDPKYEPLRQRHVKLIDGLSEAHEDERDAARQDERLSVHCSYAPVAVLLRAALGCDAKGASTACNPLTYECPR